LRSKITGLLRSNEITEAEAIELFCCGKYLVTKPGKIGKGSVSQKSIDLYWSWVWDPKISGEPPKVGEASPMWLSTHTGVLSKSEEEGHFDWWISVSSLEKGSRIHIPLATTPFLKEGFLKSIMARKKHGVWHFQFGETEPRPIFSKEGVSSNVLGVDVGLNTLLALSNGSLYGAAFKPKFDSLYKEIRAIRSNRQRQGFKENSPRLGRLEEKLSGMMKTEIGKIVNKVVAENPDTTFVVEDLDLSGCKGQKRFAYRLAQKRLEAKAKVHCVNPAYTSQMCPSCGYVARSNRSGVNFHCRACGRKAHADWIGSFNLLGRSKDKKIKANDSPFKVKSILNERYLASRGRVPKVGNNLIEILGQVEILAKGLPLGEAHHGRASGSLPPYQLKAEVGKALNFSKST
jgi:predicted RNA-binding Zn-ribbon protein involved in translation (DUF1610 family)